MRAALGALREAALEEFERAQDRPADTIERAAADTLQQASDRQQELASGLRSHQDGAGVTALREANSP